MRGWQRSTNRLRMVLVLIGMGMSTTLLADSRSPEGRAGVRSEQRTLTLEERVVHQRAIEEVYWRHRMWPAENRTPKPTLEQVTPPASIRQKVDNYPRESEALDAYWHRPITGEQLQAEMDRMARQTKKAALLEELRAALGNDPDVIAECLARPALVNRLIRNWYAA